MTAKEPWVRFASSRQMYVSACSASTEQRMFRSSTRRIDAFTSPGSCELRLETRHSTSRVPYAGIGISTAHARSRAFCIEKWPSQSGCSRNARSLPMWSSGLLDICDHSSAPASISRTTPETESCTLPTTMMPRREIGFLSKNSSTHSISAPAVATARDGLRSPSIAPALFEMSHSSSTCRMTPRRASKSKPADWSRQSAPSGCWMRRIPSAPTAMSSQVRSYRRSQA
mmetsp:Transcript_42636/g.105750  ORF Transcript_42636/g.105750 Transcript_42636/m.105750 type:complete len:228 (+) Transcript_42636:628-1311(+)